MRIRKFIHSCLLVESNDTRILFDPGKFSFLEGGVQPESFRELDAIVLTHQHPDHMDDAALQKIVGQNPSAAVLASVRVGHARRRRLHAGSDRRRARGDPQC